MSKPILPPPRKFGLAILWLLGWAAVGYLLLVLAFSLPTARMRSHLESMVDTFSNGSIVLVKDDMSTHLDYLTEATILSEAIYDGSESAFIKAAAIYSVTTPSNESRNYSYDKLTAALSSDGDAPRGAYDRYWQGQNAVLRPLLLLLDYKDILRLNMLVQLGLMLCIAYLLARRQLGYFLLPFVILFGALTPTATSLCLQYTPCFLIMASGCVFLLCFPDAARAHSWLVFLSLGMATSYFDFLTYPLVTLGVPLVLYLYLQETPWKQRLQQIVCACLWWGIGYIGFWAEKWLLGSLVLRQNLFIEARDSILLRASHETLGQTITYAATLKNNLQPYASRTWILLWGLLAVGSLLLALRRRVLTVRRVTALAPLVLVACMPFVWYYFTQNHSYIHFGFTHRELVITFFALSCFFVRLCRRDE